MLRYEELEKIGEAGYYDYQFHLIGAFYHPVTTDYYFGESSGCSCYSPWDDEPNELENVYTKTALIKKIHRYRDDDPYGFEVEDVNRLAQAVRKHAA